MPGDARIDPLIVTAFDPDDPLAGAVRGLRSTVLATARAEGGPIKSLLLVGAGAATETTIAASNLAVACAQAGRRTLLVDANLGLPAAHVLFRVPGEKGLSTMLSEGDGQWRRLVQRTAISSLDVLPAGPPVPNGPELLDRARAARHVDAFSDVYDLVIVEAGSVNDAPAALSFCEGADAAIVVVHEQVSRKSDVKRTIDLLAERGTPILGAVMAI